jgi:hypothetical protein
VSGYLTPDGQLRFIDPSVIESGPSSLLVDADYLREFLSTNSLTIFWTVIGEKLRIIDEPWPRLVYSRVHMLTPDGLRSSKPVITDK